MGKKNMGGNGGHRTWRKWRTKKFITRQPIVLLTCHWRQVPGQSIWVTLTRARPTAYCSNETQAKKNSHKNIFIQIQRLKYNRRQCYSITFQEQTLPYSQVCKHVKDKPKYTSSFIAGSQKIITQKLNICYFYVLSTNYFTAFGPGVQQLPNSSRTKCFPFSLKPLNTLHISHENSLPTSCFPRYAKWSDSNLKMAATQHFFEAPHKFKNFSCHSKLLFHKQH